MTSLLDGMHIAFVDDEPYAMRPTIEALEARGAVVELLIDGSQILEYIKTHKGSLPDLVVLDIMLTEGPDIKTEDEGRSTGVEVYRRIRREHRLIPIVISTVVSDGSILAAFGNDRRTAVVTKPYYFDDLCRAIERVTQKR